MDNIHEIVVKLIGSVKPIGETRTDDKRFENLKATCELVDKLLFDIDDVIPNKDCVEFSMKRAGEYADKFMTKIGITE